MTQSCFITEQNKNNPFKNDFGIWLVKAIFIENSDQGTYTIKDTDQGDVRSLKRLYLEMEDVTEYAFACKYLGGWDHWLVMVEANYFKPHITKWRTELELKLRSESLRAIIDEARIGGRNSYDAKKYLISKGWVSKEAETNRRGRPSKAEIARLAAEEVFGKDIEQDALKRLEVN